MKVLNVEREISTESRAEDDLVLIDVELGERGDCSELFVSDLK